MIEYQHVVAIMATAEMQRKHGDHTFPYREATTAELDHLAEFGWPWVDVTQRVVAWVNTIAPQWRSRSASATAFPGAPPRVAKWHA